MTDAIAAAVSSAIEPIKNGLFAEARRTFQGQKPPKTPPPEGTPATPAEPNAMQLRALDRELGRTGHATKLTPAQYARLERSFAAEMPEDVVGWVKDYFEGWASSPPPAAPAGTPPTPPQPNNRAPISDAGTPPQPKPNLDQIDLFSATEAERREFIKTKGLAAYTKLLNAQMQNRKIVLKR